MLVVELPDSRARCSPVAVTTTSSSEMTARESVKSAAADPHGSRTALVDEREITHRCPPSVSCLRRGSAAGEVALVVYRLLTRVSPDGRTSEHTRRRHDGGYRVSHNADSRTSQEVASASAQSLTPHGHPTNNPPGAGSLVSLTLSEPGVTMRAVDAPSPSNREASMKALLLSLTVALAGCGPTVRHDATAHQPSGTFLISAEQIAKSGAQNAWQVLQRSAPMLVAQNDKDGRPGKLTRRGRSSLLLDDSLVVLLDGVRIPDFRNLDTVG